MTDAADSSPHRSAAIPELHSKLLQHVPDVVSSLVHILKCRHAGAERKVGAAAANGGDILKKASVPVKGDLSSLTPSGRGTSAKSEGN